MGVRMTRRASAVDARNRFALPLSVHAGGLASTYRIQLRQGVTFDTVAQLASHLAELGVSDCYLSPIFLARAGSKHGYDVCDMTMLDPALGGLAGFERMRQALRDHGLGLVLDIVPNHMATDPQRNRRWRDVLSHGQASVHAESFDIAWTPLGHPELHGRILLPILDRTYGEALEEGLLVVEESDEGPRLNAGGMRLPLSGAPQEAGRLNGRPEDPASFGPLHDVLERQPYRLAWWRTSSDDLNYRRFFNIEHLIGVAVERSHVFDDTHQLIRALVAGGGISGLRVDHVDGLADPQGYLERLDALIEGHNCVIVVEKILSGDEQLPDAWPVWGTTGYEFLNAVTRLLVPGRTRPALRAAYERFTRDRRPFEATAAASRRLILDTVFVADVDLLVEGFHSLADSDWRTRDLTRRMLRHALVDLLVAFPVYRTYVDQGGASAVDRAVLEQALAAVQPATEPAVRALAFVRSILVAPPGSHHHLSITRRFQQLSSAVFAKAVEDTAFYRDNTLLALNEVGASPARADSAVRAFHRLNADRAKRSRGPGLSATATHDTKLGEDARARLLALSHWLVEWRSRLDGWRTAHRRYRRRVRGRLAPDRHDEYRFYQAVVAAWPPERLGEAPGPELISRLQQYLEKSAREARRWTTWEQPDTDYENAVRDFISAVLTDRTFLAGMMPLASEVARAAAVLSLTQVILKVTSPGAPDIYQGTEGWTCHLVDPDNREPPDFAALRAALASVQAGRVDSSAVVDALLGTWRDGRIKLHVLSRALHARRANQELFGRGAYHPMRSGAGGRDPVVAFARTVADGGAIVVAVREPRPFMADGGWPVGNVWKDLKIRMPVGVPHGPYRDCVTGQSHVVRGHLRVSEALRHCPVALLILSKT